MKIKLQVGKKQLTRLARNQLFSGNLLKGGVLFYQSNMNQFSRQSTTHDHKNILDLVIIPCDILNLNVTTENLQHRIH